MFVDILVGAVLLLCLVISSVALLPPPPRHGRTVGHHRAGMHWPRLHH